MAQRGFPIVILEAASRLEEIGAGIQLSPNASRILMALGLREALASRVAAPAALRIMNARTARQIATLTLGPDAQERYGAPFWVVHRGDLQRALLNAVHAHPLITLRLGTAVAGHAFHADGVAVAAKWRDLRIQENGAALIGADGLHSVTRNALGISARPKFHGSSAWRATVPASALPEGWVDDTHLWLGGGAHLVHYPVQAGRAINLVAIVKDTTERDGWNASTEPALLLSAIRSWPPDIRAVLSSVPKWRAWSLYELPVLDHWGDGPVTLLGDAAHAMLPFVAQGAAMAIEDAWTLAACVSRHPDDIAAAFRTYEQARMPRTGKAARAAASTGRIYGLPRALADARNIVMRMMGDERLRRRYDWIYGWTHDDQARQPAKE